MEKQRKKHITRFPSHLRLLAVQVSWENTLLSLVIPCLDPVDRAQGLVSLPESLARSKVLTLQVYALVVVHI